MRMIRALAIALLSAGCAHTPPAPPPEPVVITKEVERIVQRPCMDQRGPKPDYPDTKEKLAAIPDDDIEQLSKVRAVGQDLRDKRLDEDDRQILGCAGP